MKFENGNCIDEMLNKAKELETALLDVKRLLGELGAMGQTMGKSADVVVFDETASVKDNYFKANEIAEGKIGELFEKAKAKVEKKCPFDWSKIEPPMNPDIDTNEPIVPTVESVLTNQYKGEK